MNPFSQSSGHFTEPLMEDMDPAEQMHATEHSFSLRDLATDVDLGMYNFDQIPFPEDFETSLPSQLASSDRTDGRPTKLRRRKTGDGETIVHRRVRSGCYTCRSRRIKCDENRPICLRCKKASRECCFPDTPVAVSRQSNSDKGSNGSAKNISRTPFSRADASTKSIPAEGTSTVHTQHSAGKRRTSQGMQHASASKPQSGSILTEQHNHSSHLSQNDKGSEDESREDGSASLEAIEDYSGGHSYSQLVPELRDLMRYHAINLNYHHYFFRSDAGSFTKEGLPAAALAYEPLLYAVCGFAAYHRAVAQDGKIPDFLGYYQRSVKLLLKSLQSGAPHTEAMLMTILQLATIEEYLGDWVSLTGHSTAATELILELWTPQTIVNTESSRIIFMWFARFDIYVSMAAARPTTFGMEWFSSMERWYYNALVTDPANAELRISWLNHRLRTITFSLTALSSRAARGLMPKEEFAKHYQELSEQLQAWGHQIVPLASRAAESVLLPDLRIGTSSKARMAREEQRGMEVSTSNNDIPKGTRAEIDGDAYKSVSQEHVRGKYEDSTNLDNARAAEDGSDSDSDPWVSGLPRANRLYLGASWPLNRLFVDLYSTAVLQRASYARIMDLTEAKAEADILAREICKFIEAIDIQNEVDLGFDIECEEDTHDFDADFDDDVLEYSQKEMDDMDQSEGADEHGESIEDQSCNASADFVHPTSDSQEQIALDRKNLQRQADSGQYPLSHEVIFSHKDSVNSRISSQKREYAHLVPAGAMLLAQSWIAMLSLYLDDNPDHSTRGNDDGDDSDSEEEQDPSSSWNARRSRDKPEDGQEYSGYRSWLRSKLARLENCGYIYPTSYRTRLAEQWNDPTLLDHWLPSSDDDDVDGNGNGDGNGDNTDFPPVANLTAHEPVSHHRRRSKHRQKSIIKDLRKFNAERESKPRDEMGEDVKNLSGFFNSLYLERDGARSRDGGEG